MLAKGLLIFFLAGCIGQSVLGRSISDARKVALEKIEGFMNEYKKQINETLTNLPVREANLKVISKHVRETGSQILESTIYNTRKTAVSGFMASILLGNPENVPSCIEDKEKKSYTESNRYFTQKFLNPANNYEREAEDMQNRDIKAWIEEYNGAVAQFTEIYERTVVDIQKSTDEEEIMRLVYDFGRNQREMEKIVTKVNGNLDRLHLQFLQILDNLVIHIRNSLRVRIDRIIVEVRECFGTFLAEKMTGPNLFKNVIIDDNEISNEVDSDEFDKDKKIDRKGDEDPTTL